MKPLAGRGALISGFLAALAAGWLLFPRVLLVREAQPVAFSHITHVQEAGMDCRDCHGVLDDGRFAGIPDVTACGECHQEPLGESSEERRLVEAYTGPGQPIPWKVYARQPDHIFFPHSVHVERAGLPCQACHGPHGETAEPPLCATDRLTGYSRSIWEFSLVRLGREVRSGCAMTECSRCHVEAGIIQGCLDCHR